MREITGPPGNWPAPIAGSLEGGRFSYSAGILVFAVAGVKAVEDDRQGAYDLLLRCWRFRRREEEPLLPPRCAP